MPSHHRGHPSKYKAYQPCQFHFLVFPSSGKIGLNSRKLIRPNLLYVYRQEGVSPADVSLEEEGIDFEDGGLGLGGPFFPLDGIANDFNVFGFVDFGGGGVVVGAEDDEVGGGRVTVFFFNVLAPFPLKAAHGNRCVSHGLIAVIVVVSGQPSLVHDVDVGFGCIKTSLKTFD